MINNTLSNISPIMHYIFTVSTSGQGLVVREVGIEDTMVYDDTIIASFDTWEEASEWAESNDSEYFDHDEGVYTQF